MQATSSEKKQKKLINKWKKSLVPKKKAKRVKSSPSATCPLSLRHKSYSAFLKSSYWKKVRASVLSRDNKECTKCKSKKVLQVHHTTYKNHFKEHLHLEDLITLCKDCHTAFHDQEATRRINISSIR